jgi:uncharacterized iron-regulated membrane protein
MAGNFALRLPSGWARTALFQVHLWIGIGIGLYILVISVSGSLIVFRREFDREFCPRIIMVSGSGRRLTEAELGARARAAYAHANFSRVEVRGSRVPGAAVEIWFLDGAFRLEHLFDPYTGKDLGDAVACEPGLVTRLADLHDNLASGRVGLLANGVGAIAVVLMSASGAVLWWPGRGRWRRSITLPRAVSGRRFIRHLHGLMGFWCFLLIVLWAATGIYFAFPGPYNELVDAVTAQGTDTATSRFLDDAIAWLVRVHFGRSFGFWIKVTWAILGLVPCALFITGFVMWWNRAQAKCAEDWQDEVAR